MAASVSWVVIKFGGTSVANLSCWKKINQIVAAHLAQGRRVWVVCSAPHRASNLLQSCWQLAAQGTDYAAEWRELHDIYTALAAEFDVDFQSVLGEEWQALSRVLTGVAMLRSASALVQAQVMAAGELLLTRLSHAFLERSGLAAQWFDARSVLTSCLPEGTNDKVAYLNAECEAKADLEWQQGLAEDTSDVVITQGFIASNRDGETVLLGRGGSDISAAYFAAKLAAVHCEIWTDVPGIYTANPHLIATARHLVELTYDEAQEIASMGAKVLHPRAILPLQRAGIPLSIRYTSNPAREGTLVKAHTNSPPAIKSVLVKNEVVLLSIEAMQMWHQAGFLADIFACFKQHRVSIDLVSTSQTNVTVSLDVKLGLLDSTVIDALVADLKKIARVQVIAPCAVISLVGCKIRKILHQVSDVFGLFRSKEVFLLSQAANDLNFAFVVEQAQAERMAQLIHDVVIQHSISHPSFGLSYDNEFGCAVRLQPQWWESRMPQLIAQAEQQTPLYLYDEAHLTQTVVDLLACDAIDRLFYAVKANPNAELLTVMEQRGLGFECVSIHEVEHVLATFPGIDPERILFTPNFAHADEYRAAFERGVLVTVDNLHPLTHWPALFAGRDILLRIDPGFGSGHHQYVETGGTHSKFGIPADDLPMVRQLTQQHDIQVIGLHAHSGSGILNATNWSTLADKLVSLVSLFPEVRALDLGGGLGIPDKNDRAGLNLAEFNASLLAIKARYPQFELWLEPGRYLVARSGVIVTRVNQIKTKGRLQYIGVDAGMHTLLRPALYGAHHPVVNLSKCDQPMEALAHIVGPICETGDVLARSRWMPATTEGDILLIANTGAYAASMSMSYNCRPKAHERLL